MCRELAHPNAHRCPSSGGELRRTRDRAVYTSQAVRGLTTPVDKQVTAMTEVFAPASVSASAQELREELHTYYHGLSGRNLGHSTTSDQDRVVIPRNQSDWADKENKVRLIGAMVENRASEIAGFTAEEAMERNKARIDSCETSDIRYVEAQILGLKATEKQAVQERNALAWGSAEREVKIELLADIKTAQVLKYEELANLTLRQLQSLGYSVTETSDSNSMVKNIKQGSDKETLADMETLANARLQALSEVRSMGGETIESNGNSSKRVQLVMAEVAGYYPADWIRASNEQGNLKLKDSVGRAHYSQSKSQKKKVQRTDIKRMPVGESPDGEGWVRGVYNGSGWSDPVTHPEYVEKYAAHAGTETGVGGVYWYRPSFNIRSNYDGTDIQGPPPKGWVDGFEKDHRGVTVRVHKQPRTHMVIAEVVSELTVDKDRPMTQWQTTRGFDTAIHEFGHRTEHVNPIIPELEEAFLQRRTTNEDGTRHSLTSIYGTRKEAGRPDSFADKYMGKEYRGQAYKEIMSTGMQGLFSGAFGNLAGTDGKTADADMRSFILGVLASA